MAARRIATLVAAACVLVTASAGAAPPPPPLIANGDFEDTTLSPWSPYAGNVRLADQTDWVAASGKQSVELSGYGRIYQDVSTTAWQRYDLSFAYAANPSAGCSGVKTLDVSWAGGLPSQTGRGGSFSFDTTGHTTASMGWQTAHLLVDATNSITGLAFGDDNAPVGCGIVIDDVAMSAPAASQTGTQLAGPEQSPVLGEPMTLTATVLGSSAALTPTGTVQFTVDGTPAGSAAPLASGTAQNTVDGLTRGTHTVEAVYTPDSISFDPSGVTSRVTVRQAQTATDLSIDPPVVALGQAATLTAEVGVLAPGAGAPTGSVQFADVYGPIGDPVPIDADGVAQIALLEDLGDHDLYAYYSGDDDFMASTGSATLSVFDPDATPPPTDGGQLATVTSLVSSKNPVNPGEPYTVTASVSPSTPSDAVLDGTIAFTVNTLPVGNPLPLDGNHSASITVPPPPVGTTRQVVRARYGGNANYLASGASLTERILLPVTTVVSTTPPPPDKTAPIFTVKLTPARLARALRSGIRVHVDCNENCSASLRLVLTARRARALGMRIRGKSIVVAEGSYDFADRRTSDIVLRFTARARKALAKAKKLPLRLTTTVGDFTGNEAVRVQTLTLKR